MDIDGIGYLALPESGSGPGVIVLQEWWGLVPHIKSVADRFAAAGFVALAPDLFKGIQTTSPDEAGRLLMALNIDQTAQDLQVAARFLLGQEAVTLPKIGVVGFCMGGQLALLAATVSDNVGAVVDFYGIHPNVHPDFSKLTAPVLGIFAENDSFVPADAVKALAASIQEAGGAIATHTYPNTDHAFFNDTRPEVYNAEAATDAWSRTLDFLQKELAA
ncbi:dienelactone hydrolase family protein [Oscillatoria sp. FACHB-1407]|uniref:dienelactone hydrolase family protein n=1 Tax=Oscillatoria sp. FACHB-1407 TaxID=2692847 RepID=UPI0018F007D6|nr:dienelactone hydrolase family protein [Oscillatoria sp. FACHB-1407]